MPSSNQLNTWGWLMKTWSVFVDSQLIMIFSMAVPIGQKVSNKMDNRRAVCFFRSCSMSVRVFLSFYPSTYFSLLRSHSHTLSLSLSLLVCLSMFNVYWTWRDFLSFLDELDYSKTLNTFGLSLMVNTNDETVNERKREMTKAKLDIDDRMEKRTSAANYLCYSMFSDPSENWAWGKEKRTLNHHKKDEWKIVLNNICMIGQGRCLLQGTRQWIWILIELIKSVCSR